MEEVRAGLVLDKKSCQAAWWKNLGNREGDGKDVTFFKKYRFEL
jgi:hypothetical protein